MQVLNIPLNFILCVEMLNSHTVIVFYMVMGLFSIQR